ncbi:MAG: 50S ribosomal protein L31 [Candidatus Omnitrophica bacterium]|nr:50S ribosomal protein L31 [Candidatus Omnitrophota bacterium]
MKEKVHPQYKECTIVCACGEVIHTRSTKQNIRVDICSKCHPFFTGEQKLMDSAGMVEKFKKRYDGKVKEQKKKKKKIDQKKTKELNDIDQSVKSKPEEEKTG